MIPVHEWTKITSVLDNVTTIFGSLTNRLGFLL